MRGKVLRASSVRTLKLLLLVFFPILAVWNWSIALVILMAMNSRSLFRVVFGRLPLRVPRSSSDGPYTHVYKVEPRPYKIDMYYPRRGDAPFPVVVFAHGGGWISGTKNQPNNLSWYRFLNYHGFAVATVDYRYGYLHHIDDIIRDYEDGVEYVRENARALGVDADRLLLMGLSAGGHLAFYHAAYHSYHGHEEEMRGVRGMITWYAPLDLTDLWDREVESLFARFSVMLTLKGLPRKNLEDYKRYSPITWIGKKMVPAFLAHGLRDGVVPVESSIKAYKRLRENGIRALLRIHPTGDHSFEFSKRDGFTTGILHDMISFMYEAIRGREETE